MDVCEAGVCEELANLQARPDESEVRRFFLLPPRSQIVAPCASPSLFAVCYKNCAYIL